MNPNEYNLDGREGKVDASLPISLALRIGIVEYPSVFRNSCSIRAHRHYFCAVIEITNCFS